MSSAAETPARASLTYTLNVNECEDVQNGALAAHLRRLHKRHLIAVFALVTLAVWARFGLDWAGVLGVRGAFFVLGVCRRFFIGGLFDVGGVGLPERWRRGRRVGLEDKDVLLE